MKGRLILLNLLILMLLLRLMDFSIEVMRSRPGRMNHLLGDVDIEYKRRLHPPLVDARFSTTSEYLSLCDGLDSSTFRLVTDRDGLIQGPSRRGSLVKGVDVLFVGGSTTECLYVDNSLRFPYLVGERLRSFHGLERVTLNGGYSGNVLKGRMLV